MLADHQNTGQDIYTYALSEYQCRYSTTYPDDLEQINDKAEAN